MASSDKNDGIINRLLLALPPKTLNRIRSVLEPVDLARGQAIAHIDQPLRYVYFVNRGLISVVKTMHDGRLVEVGAIGIEGMTSAITLIGFDKIVLEAIVQIPGSAFRMSRDAAIRAMQNDKAFRIIVHITLASYSAKSHRLPRAMSASSGRTLLSVAADCA